MATRSTLRQLLERIDAQARVNPDRRGYGYIDSQQPWRYWPAIEHTSRTFRALLELMIRHEVFGTVLQIGLGRFGGSHTAFRNFVGRVVTIEIDALRVEEFAAAHDLHEGSDHLIVGDSADPAVQARARELAVGCDLLLIDGGDSYEELRGDWQAYAPLVRDGGIVAIADRSQAYPATPGRRGADLLAFDLQRDYLLPRGLELERLGFDTAIHFYRCALPHDPEPRLPVRRGSDAAPPSPAVVEHRGFSIFQHDGAAFAVRGRHRRFESPALTRAEYELVLRGKDVEDSVHLVDAFLSAQPPLEEARALLGAGRLEAATAATKPLIDRFPDLRERLIPSYDAQPHSRELQELLGTLGVLGDRPREGVALWHRALTHDIHNQPLLLALFEAYKLRLEDQEGQRRLLADLRRQAARLRVTSVCEDLRGHLLWRYPQLLFDVRGVIDVGAHCGELVGAFEELEIAEQVYVEPHPQACEQLRRRCAATPNGVTTRVFETALGAGPGTQTLRTGADSRRSSLLPVHPLLLQTFPEEVQTGGLEVTVRTLDEVMASSELDPGRFNLLLLDVEGTELQVLRGATETLRHIDTISVSTCTTEVHEGSPQPEEIQKLLRDQDDRGGFNLRAYELGPDGRRGTALFRRARVRR